MDANIQQSATQLHAGLEHEMSEGAETITTALSTSRTCTCAKPRAKYS